MLEQIRKFRVTALTVQGFKGHKDPVTYQFGDLNEITGHMGVGKSSIADAIAFAITGVTFFGSSKLDSLYHNGQRDLLVDMSFDGDDEKAHRLVRRRVNDNMDIFLDERKVTQRDLSVLFGEKDLFLAIFNPLYFIEVLGSKGRDLLERYLPEIPREKILEGLSEDNRSLLAKQNFLSPEAYAKQLRAEQADHENDLVYIQGQIDLLSKQAQEQTAALREKEEALKQASAQIEVLEHQKTLGFDGADLKDKLADLYARHEELCREAPDIPDTGAIDRELESVSASLERRKAEVYQSKYADALAGYRAELEKLRKEVLRQKHIYAGLKPGIQCPVCRQTVTEAILPALRKEFQNSVHELCQQGKSQAEQLNELQELDAKAKETFEQFKQEDIAAGEAKAAELRQRRTQIVASARATNEQRTQQAADLRGEIQNLELDLECGRLTSDDNETLMQLKESVQALTAEIAVLRDQVTDLPGKVKAQEQLLANTKAQIIENRDMLTAVSRYISRRAELVFEAVKMNRVSISLYDVAKSTGEVRDVFKFNYEDRPYICLSHSEKIRAGLEVSELIKRIAGVNFPVFIDDTESVPVIDNVRPSGQIFLAKVVKGTKLNVRISSLNSAPKAA